MNLFYQPTITDGVTHLNADESRHAVQVLRMTDGDPLEVTDGKGFFYFAKIIRANPKKCEFDILEKKEEAKREFYIHLAIAPTKNADRIEWFVEKAVETGIDEISFIRCQNSERKVINIERVEKIAVSAMKQSQQARLPKLNSIIPFNEILTSKAGQKFIAHVDATNPTHLKTASHLKKKYLILIGPEGDFSHEELEQSLQNGFIKVSLGHNRLRTETAGLAACQIIHFINS